MKVNYINVDLIVTNQNQPRKYFDDEKIEQLADSIKQFGVLQPIIVKANGERYEIIAGERRYRACLKAGLAQVPVIVSEVDRYDASRISIVENIQREDLSAIEEAYAYKSLIEDYDLTQVEVSEAVGKKPSTISNKLRLLKLVPDVQEAIKSGEISERHGRAMLSLSDDDQIKYLDKIKAENLTVSKLESIVEKEFEKKKPKAKRVGISNDYKLATNTIKQAVSLIEQTGLKVVYNENALDDGVEINIVVTRSVKK